MHTYQVGQIDDPTTEFSASNLLNWTTYITLAIESPSLRCYTNCEGAQIPSRTPCDATPLPLASCHHQPQPPWISSNHCLLIISSPSRSMQGPPQITFSDKLFASIYRATVWSEAPGCIQIQGIASSRACSRRETVICPNKGSVMHNQHIIW